jgi:hypothetical protein
MRDAYSSNFTGKTLPPSLQQGCSITHSTEKTMKKTATLTLALLSAIMIPALQQVHAASQPFDGVISDSMCGKKHTMAAGKTDAQCVQECIKSGSSYALVAGSKVYTLAAKPQTIAPFAGKQVHIEGDVKGNTIKVTSISEMPKNMKM